MASGLRRSGIKVQKRVCRYESGGRTDDLRIAGARQTSIGCQESVRWRTGRTQSEGATMRKHIINLLAWKI
jgi:hypothetical protein